MVIELEPTNLHWFNTDNPEEDLCAHGGVYLKIDDSVFLDGSEPELTLSAASYRLLGTVWFDYDYKENPANHLVPCCGFDMVKLASAEDELCIFECPNGINWQVSHHDGHVVHRFKDGQVAKVTEEKWEEAVCSFSRKVFDFFIAAGPKKCEGLDREFREGFELFMKLWRGRLDQVCKRQ